MPGEKRKKKDKKDKGEKGEEKKGRKNENKPIIIRFLLLLNIFLVLGRFHKEEKPRG